MKEKLSDITHLLNMYRSSHQIPGLAVSMIDDGEVVYSQGFGTPHAESPYNLVTSDTLFSIQGITETFTASALVHLEEQTSFNLDTPVVEYLPFLNRKDNVFRTMTTTHLLSHTAGFRVNYRIVPLLDKGVFQFVKNMPEYKSMTEGVSNIDKIRDELAMREDVTKYLSEMNLKTDPGQQFYYYGDAYMIAADVLEKVSGMTWEEYVSMYIFEPLGLTDTFVNLPSEVNEKRAAKYYMKGIGDLIQTPTPYNSIGAPVGSIFTTAADLSTYIKAQMAPGKFLSQTGLEKMQKDQVKIGEAVGYGIGWKIRNFQGLKVVEQTGSYPGISSAVSFIPEEKFGLVFLCNTDMIQLDKLARRVIKRWFS